MSAGFGDRRRIDFSPDHRRVDTRLIDGSAEGVQQGGVSAVGLTAAFTDAIHSEDERLVLHRPRTKQGAPGIAMCSAAGEENSVTAPGSASGLPDNVRSAVTSETIGLITRSASQQPKSPGGLNDVPAIWSPATVSKL